MDFRGASMQLQLHNLESKSKSLTRLSPNLVKPMMSRHSMTLSRHQNKLLQTPATLETLVPLQFRCIVLKPRRQHVSTHGYHHGAACGKGFVSFFLVGARSAGHHLRLTRRPAGNRTTTGSLSASFYQLSHGDTCGKGFVS